MAAFRWQSTHDGRQGLSVEKGYRNPIIGGARCGLVGHMNDVRFIRFATGQLGQLGQPRSGDSNNTQSGHGARRRAWGS
jgi:hypothetical protein